MSDKDMLDEVFKETIKTLYDWRSEFVHGERLPPITEFASLYDLYDGKPIIVELTTSQLRPIFEAMVKRYFDAQQKRVHILPSLT